MLTVFFFLFHIKAANNVYYLTACPPDGAVFNLCFLENGQFIKTTCCGTYGYGYFMVLMVDGVTYDVSSPSERYADIQITTLMLNMSGEVAMQHILENKGTRTKRCSLAIHADTQIYTNDRVPIYRVGNNKGIEFREGIYQIYLLFNQVHPGHPAVDTIWYGVWNNRTNNLWVNAATSSYTTGDSGIAYSFQNFLCFSASLP